MEGEINRDQKSLPIDESQKRLKTTNSAIALVITATAFMSIQDAVVKLISSNLPLWQIFTVRSVIALVLLLAMAAMHGGSRAFWPRNPGWAILRGSLLVAMYVTFYAALSSLQLSVVAAAYYTGPLFITLFAALLLGEKVGTFIIGAMVLGFLGVLVILQPGSDGISTIMLVPIASAIFYALAMVLTRGRCADETLLSLSIILNFCFLICGIAIIALLAVIDLPLHFIAKAPFLLEAWVTMDYKAWGVITLLAVFTICIHIALARAYQIGEPAVVASFDYSYLLFAVMWGFVLLSETPALTTIAGMAMIAGAGLIVIFATKRRI